MDDYPESSSTQEARMLNQLGATISEEEELKMLNFPSKREDLSTAIPLTVIFALLLVTGCVGNLCTAIVIARPKNKYMHTATNYYLFSLAMSDFLFLILGLPQEMYTLWQRYPYAFGESFCIIRGYLSEASTYASILTISAFTVERYVAICHPLWAHTMSQLPRAITSILIIWIVSAICAIPPAAELGIITQKGPITNRTLEESAQCATKRTIYENMFAVSAIVFFIVPMIIVTVLYILIALELRRSSKMNAAISKQTSSHLHSSSASNSGRCHLHHKHHQSHSNHLFTGGHKRQPSRALKQSLMADIMSQRPQSAIGTEQPALPLLTVEAGSTCALSAAESTCSAKRGAWPLGLFGPAASCVCRQQVAASARLVASSSLQPQQGAQPAPSPETPNSLCRAHSPLSYHESLIGQRPSTANSSCPAPTAILIHSQRLNKQQPESMGSQRGAVHAHQRANGGHGQHSRRSAAASGKKSVIRMLVAVVVSFFICWLPFHAQRLMASYLVKDENRNQLLLDTYLKLTYISGVMYYLSSTINPLLYQLMSAKFRLAFKETFNCSLLKCAFFSRKHQQSPTNSLKEHHHHHNATQQQHHLRRLTCDCPTCLQSSQFECNDCIKAAAAISSSSGQQHQRDAYYQQVGVMARLRGRLHVSLMSLFKPTLPEAACTCAPQVTQCPSSNVLPLTNSCVSTPLLMEPAADRQEPPSPFPAHSVLKFVRGPTPLCPAVAPCLTRLSSREEESNGDDKTEVAAHKDSMGALIRPTDASEQPESLITMTSESGGSSAASSSPESASTGQRRDSSRRLQVAQTQKRHKRQTQNTPTDLRRKSSSSSTAGCNPNKLRQLSVQSSTSSNSAQQLDKKLSVSTTTSAIDCGSYTTTNSQLTRADSGHLPAQLSREHSSTEDTGSSEPSTTVISLVEGQPKVGANGVV